MTAEELKEELSLGYTDYEFEYQGKQGAICPFNDASGAFHAAVVYNDFAGEFTDLNKLMNTPFICGKTLAEVAEEL